MNVFSLTRSIRTLGAALFAVLIVVSSFAAPLIAEAQREPGSTGANGAAATVGLPPAGEVPAQDPTPDTTTQTSTETTASSGNNGGLEQGLGPLIMAITVPAYLIFHFANFLLYLSGQFFNWMVLETVLKFGLNFGTSEGLLTAWGILRDLANIFLLFSFIFIGIATILNLHDYTMKKTLPRLLIFAVLLNFSLFATQAIIDVTNGLSAAIVGQASAGVTCPAGSERDDCARNYGISGVIMDASGGSALHAPDFFIQSEPGTDFAGHIENFFRSFSLDQQLALLTTLLGLTLFASILCIVFISAGIMLLIRTIVLALLMVTSPIGFAGLVVPFMSDIAKKWWHTLVNQAFFAPVFLLLVFVGLKIAESAPFQSNNIVAALRSGDINAFGAIVMFAVVCGFMVAAIIIAKRFGAVGADFAIGMGSKVGNMPLQAWGAFGRNTVGAYANRMALNAYRRGTEGGRLRAQAYSQLTKMSFNPGGALGQLPGFKDVGIGGSSGGASHGFHGVVEEQAKNMAAYDEEMNKASKHELHELHQKRDRIKGDSASAQRRRRALDKKILANPIGRLESEKQEQQLAQTRVNEQNAELARAIDRLARAQERVDRNPSNRDAQQALAEATASHTQAESRLDEARANLESHNRAITEIQSELSLGYAAELERIQNFWGRVNPTLGLATAEARETILERYEDPEKYANKQIISYLKEIAKGTSAGSGHAAPAHAATHDTGHAPQAPSGGGGHDAHH